MVSLVDIGPLRDEVDLRGKKVETRGVSASTIFMLLSNSDELRRIFAGREINGEMLVTLVEQAPLAVAEIIAAGTGKAGDAPTIDFAFRELAAGESYDLLKSILGMTFPRGVQSFVEELTALARKAEERGWARVTRSPVQSSAASGQDTTSTDAGATPRDSSQPSQS